MKNNKRKFSNGKQNIRAFQEVIADMVEFKSTILNEKEVSKEILKGQYYVDKEILCLNTRTEDMETNTRVLIGEMKDLVRMIARMEHSQE